MNDTDYLEILRHNQGFTAPERWLAAAKELRFKRVLASTLPACPDCGGAACSPFAQYIHYSNLIRLRICARCGLVFADVQLDHSVISAHFESTYKDEEYFSERRRDIFDQVASLVDDRAPLHGSVLDVGGAKGHLLAQIARARPDLRLVLSDISPSACEAATREHGLESVCGDLTAVKELGRSFDVVLLIDVLYYAPDLRTLFATLPDLLKERGTLVLRIPNKWWLIRAGQLLLSHGAAEMQKQVRYFNPEHIYVFRRAYLQNRLESLGFDSVRFVPARPLRLKALRQQASRAAFTLARLVHLLSFGALTPTPSLLVLARRA